MKKLNLFKKMFLSLTVLSVIIVLAAGCNPDAPKTSDSSKGSNANPNKKTIRLWDNEQNEVLFSIITEFEELHKDVEIIVESPGETTLSMAISAGTAPDIIQTPSDYVATYGEEGYLLDLNQFNAGEIKALFSETTWNTANIIKDKIYSLPFDSNIINFVYNKDMFDASGAQVPKTYDEFLTAANKIKAHYAGDTSKMAYTAAFNSMDVVGYKAWGTFQYYWWMWRMGGDIFSADRAKTTINEAPAVDALQKLVDLKNNGLASDKYLLSEFFAGNVAMIEITTRDFFESAISSGNADFRTALMPKLKDDVDPITGLGLYCYGVTSNSTNAQLAYDFLKFYCTNVEAQINYCKPYYFIPSLVEAQKDPYYNTEDWKIILEQAQYARATPGVTNWRAMDDAVYDAIQDAVSGSKSPKAALDAAAAQIENLKK